MVSKLVQSETILDHFKSKSIMWPKSSEKWKKLTMSLAKWFCKNSRSTAMVEDEGFAAFMALACPSYELPSRKTLSKYIEELYQKEHKKIKGSLEDVKFCAITTDGGSTLCVPGTSTQAERVFSWMGWLLNKRRLSMSGETVSMQLFLNLVL